MPFLYPKEKNILTAKDQDSGHREDLSEQALLNFPSSPHLLKLFVPSCLSKILYSSTCSDLTVSLDLHFLMKAPMHVKHIKTYLSVFLLFVLCYGGPSWELKGWSTGTFPFVHLLLSRYLPIHLVLSLKTSSLLLLPPSKDWPWWSCPHCGVSILHEWSPFQPEPGFHIYCGCSTQHCISDFYVIFMYLFSGFKDIAIAINFFKWFLLSRIACIFLIYLGLCPVCQDNYPEISTVRTRVQMPASGRGDLRSSVLGLTLMELNNSKFPLTAYSRRR